MHTPKPVDVSALRAKWKGIVARHADRKTQRVAVCCWENIGIDLLRYGRNERLWMFLELLDDDPFGCELEYRLEHNGPKAAAAWFAEELGVSLDAAGEQQSQ